MMSPVTSTALVLLLGVAAAQEILFCGPLLAPYQELSYFCDGDFLCPIVAGQGHRRCGSSCFSETQYACNDGILLELPEMDTPFQVAVWRKDVDLIHGKTLTAKQGKFLIGEKQDVTCPLPDCSDFKNITVFAGKKPGAFQGPVTRAPMEAVVPGGQQALIEKSGEFSYSIPHSAFVPQGEYNGTGQFKAYKGGEFIFTGGEGWQACFIDDTGIFQIVQKVPGYVQTALCLDVKLVTKDPGVKGPYAWEY